MSRSRDQKQKEQARAAELMALFMGTGKKGGAQSDTEASRPPRRSPSVHRCPSTSYTNTTSNSYSHRRRYNNNTLLLYDSDDPSDLAFGGRNDKSYLTPDGTHVIDKVYEDIDGHPTLITHRREVKDVPAAVVIKLRDRQRRQEARERAKKEERRRKWAARKEKEKKKGKEKEVVDGRRQRRPATSSSTSYSPFSSTSPSSSFSSPATKLETRHNKPAPKLSRRQTSDNSSSVSPPSWPPTPSPSRQQSPTTHRQHHHHHGHRTKATATNTARDPKNDTPPDAAPVARSVSFHVLRRENRSIQDAKRSDPSTMIIDLDALPVPRRTPTPTPAGKSEAQPPSEHEPMIYLRKGPSRKDPSPHRVPQLSREAANIGTGTGKGASRGESSTTQAKPTNGDRVFAVRRPKPPPQKQSRNMHGNIDSSDDSSQGDSDSDSDGGERDRKKKVLLLRRSNLSRVPADTLAAQIAYWREITSGTEEAET
ncbi:hypothetical protein F5Y17DRAFT_438241 [Xylariaceae sp. FL0594]|nr:hypothetical protein F5Y17DRAFT_438241 [Xylariaceae sp. FL0594]